MPTKWGAPDNVPTDTTAFVNFVQPAMKAKCSSLLYLIMRESVWKLGEPQTGEQKIGVSLVCEVAVAGAPIPLVLRS